MNRLITTAPLPGTAIDPRYPDSDGRFVGETDFHGIAMSEVRDLLIDHFADSQDVYVTSNLLWYFKEGDRKARRDPDVLFARGVRGKHMRRSFRAWEEQVVPQVLFEMASEKTWRKDLGEKRDLYAHLGVKEYFVFDPESCFLDPVFRGWKSVKGQPIPLKPAADGSLVSKQLGLRMTPDGHHLRFVDLNTGEVVRTRAERADEEKLRADELAAEVERLRRLLGDQSPPPG